jgi:uncharacterized protein (DUF983 family)
MATKKIILVGIICTIIVYMSFAFANVNLNPKMWGNAATGICAFCMAAVLILTLVGVIINEINNDSNGNKEIHP